MATQQSSRYAFGTWINLPFAEAVERTRTALAAEGFGILTEIDVKQTLKAKRGTDFRPYVILGACNPALAERALTEELDLGVLLPCNVVVYEDNGGSVVRAVDPEPMFSLIGNPQLEPIAREVRQHLHAALQRVVEPVAIGR